MSVRRYVVFLSALFLLALLLSPWGALSFDLLFFGLLTAFLARFSVPLPLVGEVRLHYLGAVADAYEAMTSDRPYRKGLPPEEAAEVIRREAGRQFSPRVAEAFLRVWEATPAWRTREAFAQASREVVL